MGIKSGKNDKKSSVFLSYDKCFFGSGQILFNLTHMPAEHHEKSVVPAFLKVSIDHLFDNLESGKKKIIVLGKSLEKVLDFGSRHLYKPWDIRIKKRWFSFLGMSPRLILFLLKQIQISCVC